MDPRAVEGKLLKINLHFIFPSVVCVLGSKVTTKQGYEILIHNFLASQIQLLLQDKCLEAEFEVSVLPWSDLRLYSFLLAPAGGFQNF